MNARNSAALPKPASPSSNFSSSCRSCSSMTLAVPQLPAAQAGQPADLRRPVRRRHRQGRAPVQLCLSPARLHLLHHRTRRRPQVRRSHPQAAQFLQSDLAGGQKAGYTFAIANAPAPAAAIKANAAMNRFIISSTPFVSARRALKSALPEEPTSARTNVSCLQCVRIHRDEDNDALDEPVRVRIGADLLETATDDLEDQRAQDDGREYVSAPAEQRDAANDDGGDGGELHAVADLGGIHPDLQRVDDACNRREPARNEQS